MNIKDGGATITVNQATKSGEQLSKAIIELLLLLLELIRDSRDDSDTRHEILKELENIRSQLDMRVELCEIFKTICDPTNVMLTPAEKLFGRGCNITNIEAFKQGIMIKQPQGTNKPKNSSVAEDLNF